MPYLSQSEEVQGSLPDKSVEDKIIIFHTCVSHNLESREQVVCSQGNRCLTLDTRSGGLIYQTAPRLEINVTSAQLQSGFMSLA